MRPAPLYEDVAAGPAGGSASFVTCADGVSIRVAVWGREAARNGTVLLMPGRTEYIEKYGPAAREFAQRGFATAVVDWRGQGLADRLAEDRILGHVHDFDDYQHDAAAFIAHVEASDLPKPHFVLAHSMGGAIGLTYLMGGYRPAAVAFSAPMWKIALSPFRRAVAWGVTAVAAPLGFRERRIPGAPEGVYHDTQPFKGNVLTKDKDMYAFMQTQTRTHPDLAIGAPSIGWLYEALRANKDLEARPAPDIPCLTAIGTDEKVVDAQAIADRMARWTNGKTLTFPGAEHEVMMEGPAARTRFYDSVAGHFVAHGSA